jgi:hypothetical protein
MHNELPQLRTPLIAIPSMPHQQFRQITEPQDTEISSQTRLSTFFTDDTYTHICSLDHADVVAAIAYTCYAFFRM